MTAKKSSPPQRRGASTRTSGERAEAGKTARSRPAPSPVRIAGRAAEQLSSLTGRESEGVTGMERTDDGWTVHVEVLELRRVPATTDVLGLYEVTTDRRGELQGYRRVRRYSRGSGDDD